ncbi:thioredoxin-2-like [Teleopsis dalmanni]|uniref:thioredoxin-2-like n=1 Tax=Teleopsis dalmanni TaxID=139649 RepID=UPI0018CCE998|nr:thioredoxin-2-like [Teleopsis dalmanni]XP_037947344.1 thioredoxin-2-like [Teleopsis dalmanni]XP_037956302.1 thioredoxin-2-like [Teleopsis dalmanni]
MSDINGYTDFLSQIKNAGEKLVLVNFMTSWCAPCHKIAPEIKQLAQENSNNLIVINVDAEQHQDIASEYNVTCFPTFTFIKDKEAVKQFHGADANQLSQCISELLPDNL